MAFTVGATRWRFGIGSTAVLVTCAYGLSPSSTSALTGTIALLVATPVFHQSIRAWIYCRLGARVSQVRVLAFGGWERLLTASTRPRTDALAGLAGLAAMVVVAATVTFWAFPLEARALRPAACWLLAFTVLQAMPALPLDGGRLAKAAGKYFTDGAVNATRPAAVGGLVVGICLVGIGSAMVLLNRGGSWPYWALWTTVAGWQIVAAGRAELRHDDRLNSVSSLPLSRVVDGLRQPLDSTMEIQAAIDHVLAAAPTRAFLVAEGDHRLVGVVTLADLRRVPRREWGRCALHDVLTPLHLVPRLTEDMTPAEALELLQRGKLGVALVERGGETLGVLSVDSLENLLLSQ